MGQVHPCFLHSWHFFESQCSWLGEYLLLRYSASSPPFPHKSSGGHANHFQGSLYFSFLPVKQRDFPGNVRSGGCDSLPLVVAFTSKQHDSPLSYALHFLHIISHQMCCAGERAERRAHQSVEKSLHLPEKNARKAGAFSEECIRLSRAATGLLSASPTPKLKQKGKKVQTSQLCIYHRSMSAQVFDVLFIWGEGWAPQLPAVTEVQPWTWPDAWL